jgi:hypothetical protein
MVRLILYLLSFGSYVQKDGSLRGDLKELERTRGNSPWLWLRLVSAIAFSLLLILGFLVAGPCS